MQERAVEVVERLFSKKLILYGDLLHCLEKERASLIDVDLTALWKISGEKEKITSELQSVREQILFAVNTGVYGEVFDYAQVLGSIPKGKRDGCLKLYRRIMTQEGEIEVLRKQNKTFIDDSLQFLDEMISVIAGEAAGKATYDNKCRLNGSGGNTFLCREV